ncbi:MAG TPA: hypothetical protein DCS93_14485 [Microscillaceae bacterium]|nr:hypothetical protein [Microscillaceae bacterium]
MKKKLLLHLSLFLIFMGSSALLFYRGPVDPAENSGYRATYLSRTEMNQAIKLSTAQDLVQPGKIYVFGQYLYINEKYKGIHIINNADPKSPKNIGFINIPGNIDLAIKDNILYADNGVDLVSINIANLNQLKVTHRNERVFPDNWAISPDGYQVPMEKDNTIFAGWENK